MLWTPTDMRVEQGKNNPICPLFPNCYGRYFSVTVATGSLHLEKAQRHKVVEALCACAATPQTHHSPLEGESANQGRQPAGEPVGGAHLNRDRQ